MIDQINLAINAAGILNEECKSVVKHFGGQLFDMLTASVNNNPLNSFSHSKLMDYMF